MTAARRLARLLGDLRVPFLWLFAAVGAALVAWPDAYVWYGGGDVRPSGAVRVGVERGGWLFLKNFGPDPRGDWHPRMLTVAVLGDPLPEEVEADPAGWERYDSGLRWSDDPEGFAAAAAGLVAGRSAEGRFRYTQAPVYWEEGEGGPPHHVVGAGASLWPLLVLAGLVGAVRRVLLVRRRARDPEGEPKPPGLARRLVRPWVLLLAGVGAWGTALLETDLGPAAWTATVARGPATAPHPRVLELAAVWHDRLAVFGDGDEPRTRSAPLAGAWFRHDPRSGGLGGGGLGGGSGPGRTKAAVSLWWLAAVGWAAGAAVLWRTRPRRTPAER